MNALSNKRIEKAFFISPVANMEKLICDMMLWTNVSEEDLYTKKEIETAFGETLSWEYLQYVREHPVRWQIPTHILYGENDNLISHDTVSVFAKEIGATLTAMKNGEHWFHTEEQMLFLDKKVKVSDYVNLLDIYYYKREKKFCLINANSHDIEFITLMI